MQDCDLWLLKTCFKNTKSTFLLFFYVKNCIKIVEILYFKNNIKSKLKIKCEPRPPFGVCCCRARWRSRCIVDQAAVADLCPLTSLLWQWKSLRLSVRFIRNKWIQLDSPHNLDTGTNLFNRAWTFLFLKFPWIIGDKQIWSSQVVPEHKIVLIGSEGGFLALWFREQDLNVTCAYASNARSE